MPTLAHISDLHFGRENPRLIEGLLQSLDEIQPQLVVISGDLTQRARKSEFIAARNFIDSLPWPYLVVAGNHDIPAYNLAQRFFTPWEKWHRYLGYPLESKVIAKDYIAIGMNTARRTGGLVDWSRGRVNREQLSIAAGYFNQEDIRKLRVVVAHHPFWLPDKHLHRHLVGGRNRAMKAIKKAGGDIILSGHVHFAYTHLLDGLIISHAGTAISNRLTAGAHNSFKVVRGNRRELDIETRAWNAMCFAITEHQFFYRTQGGWKEQSCRSRETNHDENKDRS